jgi:ribose-phosphate pyrophosphokinase
MSSNAPAHTSATLVFSTRRYEAMRDRVCETEELEPGYYESRLFPDEERYLRLETDCADRDVALIGGTVSETDTLTIFDLACGLVGQGARSLTLVIPYFGYQTMERAEKPGEVVTAKTRAHLLSAIPVASAGNRVVLVDVHAPGIPYYFDAHVRPVHLFAQPVVTELIRRVGGEGFVLAATDAGRAKWVEKLANELDASAAFVFKRRLGPEQTEVTAMSADVAGRPVVIYDDMIRTGSSLLSAARTYLDAGATSIAAVATHGVFPGDSLHRLIDSGVLSRIACTDTHPRATELDGRGILEVGSVARSIARLLSTGEH